MLSQILSCVNERATSAAITYSSLQTFHTPHRWNTRSSTTKTCFSKYIWLFTCHI